MTMYPINSTVTENQFSISTYPYTALEKLKFKNNESS